MTIVIVLFLALILYVLPTLYVLYCVHIIIDKMDEENYDVYKEFNLIELIFSAFVPFWNIFISALLYKFRKRE